MRIALSRVVLHRLARPATLVLLVGSLSSLAGSPLPGETQRPLGEQLALFEDYLGALIRQARLPGLSATIRLGGVTVWERGYGYQDLEHGVATTPDTLYHIASLTKTFTAALLMSCVERNSLDLSSPIAKYTNQIAEPGATVRDVLTHMSAGTPGTHYQYDGNRFAALTAVVESCIGAPYRVALATEILDRLAMRDTVPGADLDVPGPDLRALFDASTLARYAGALDRLAKPYTAAPRNTFGTGTFPPKTINASAGLLSSVRDLAKYDRGLDDYILLRSGTEELMWTAATTRAGAPIPYGYGWFVQSYRGERLVWHYGLFTDYSALYLKIPARGATLILLSNGNGLSAPFPLDLGDVTTSPFARLFLGLFL